MSVFGIAGVQMLVSVADNLDIMGRQVALTKRLDNLSKLFVNDEIGIRAFVFNDPEGYQIEIQSATRQGA